MSFEPALSTCVECSALLTPTGFRGSSQPPTRFSGPLPGHVGLPPSLRLAAPHSAPAVPVGLLELSVLAAFSSSSQVYRLLPLRLFLHLRLPTGFLSSPNLHLRLLAICGRVDIILKLFK